MVSFSLPNRNGHHQEYKEFLVKYWGLKKYSVLTTHQEKMEAYKRGDTIILLDIDMSDLSFALTTYLSKKWGNKSDAKLIGISVRATEFLQKKRSLLNLLLKKGRLYYVKRVVKGWMFSAFKSSRHVVIYGIFADSQNQEALSKYCTAQIHDFQYYDLSILDKLVQQPKELKGKSISSSLVVFIGSNLERRNIPELLHFLSQPIAKGLEVLLVGNLNLTAQRFTASIEQITRRLSDEELLWCLQNGACTYCYYGNNAPSGFFGRSVQFGTKVLVKKGSYLSKENI